MKRVELRIESLAAGGDGVARDPEGRVVFVPYAAPGDRVRVRIERERKRHAHGEIEELLEAGPDRVDARCAVHGRCGGCGWQHLSYAAQGTAKQRVVRDALERVGHFDAPPALEWFPSPHPYAYRGRARLHVSGEDVGFRARGSNELVPVSNCPVLEANLDAALGELARDAAGGALSEAEEWELSATADGVVTRTALPAVGGTPRRVAAGSETLRVSPGVFVQANPALLGVWIDWICAAAGGGDACLELYAGAGFLSLPLARNFARLACVELSAPACRDLAHNLREVGLDADVRRAAVMPDALGGWLARDRPDTVVLDPPRAGLGAKNAARLGDSGATRVVYAACDPAPWARDLAVLREAGFRLARCAAFDFFPQTAHVETAALLER